MKNEINELKNQIMKKLLLLPILALLFAALISCEKDQSIPADEADEMVTTRANAAVPFKAVYITSPVVTAVDPNTGTLTIEIPSAGKGAHLGRSAWYSDSYVYDTFLDEDGPWRQDGSSIFTAADGSQLVGAFEGTTGPTETSPFAGTGNYWIDYGTKRFEGATGSGTYSYAVFYVDPETGAMKARLEFTGTLVNP